MISYTITDKPIHYKPAGQPLHFVVTTQIDYVVGSQIYYVAKEA
ncbi:hypothetical protein [Gimesia maris]